MGRRKTDQDIHSDREDLENFIGIFDHSETEQKEEHYIAASSDDGGDYVYESDRAGRIDANGKYFSGEVVPASGTNLNDFHDDFLMLLSELRCTINDFWMLQRKDWHTLDTLQSDDSAMTRGGLIRSLVREREKLLRYVSTRTSAPFAESCYRHNGLIPGLRQSISILAGN